MQIRKFLILRAVLSGYVAFSIVAMVFAMMLSQTSQAENRRRPQEVSQEFPPEVYPDELKDNECIQILANYTTTGEGLYSFLGNLTKLTSEQYVEVPQSAISLGPNRHAEINDFLEHKTVKRLIGLLSDLLPEQTRFKLAGRNDSVSIGPIIKGENASIEYVNDEFKIAIQTEHKRKKSLRAEFKLGPFNMPAQEILNAGFVHNGLSPHGLMWWRHFQVLIKDHDAVISNRKQFFYQELNLYYDMSRNLRVIAIRNKGPGRLARWHEQYMYVPSVLIVPKPWVEYHATD